MKELSSPRPSLQKRNIALRAEAPSRPASLAANALFAISALSLVSSIWLSSGCASVEGEDAQSLMYLERCRNAENTVFDENGAPASTGIEVESSLPVITGKVSIADAVNIALANNLDLRATFLKREEASGAVTEAKSAALPHFNLGANATSDMAERGDIPETYSLTWSVAQPLWHSGAVSAGLSYANLYKASTDELIRKQVQETMYDVVCSYYGVLLSQQMVKVYTDAVGVAERMLETAQKQQKAGTASNYEVLRAEVEVASTRAALIKEENSFRTACVNLVQKLGANQNSSITLVDSMKYVEEENDFSELIATAMLHRPDILQAEAAVRMAEENLKIAKSDYGPSADFVVKGEYGDPDPNDRSLDEWNHDWSVGVQLSYKLFDGYARQGKVAQAESKLRQAKLALQNAEEAARVDVVRALLDVSNADELFHSQSKNIDLSREALRMLESGHKVGKNTQIEVLDARSALTEAMGQYYNAVYSHEVARLSVRKAIGTLGFDASNVIQPEISVTEDQLGVPAAGQSKDAPAEK